MTHHPKTDKQSNSSSCFSLLFHDQQSDRLSSGHWTLHTMDADVRQWFKIMHVKNASMTSLPASCSWFASLSHHACYSCWSSCCSSCGCLILVLVVVGQTQSVHHVHQMIVSLVEPKPYYHFWSSSSHTATFVHKRIETHWVTSCLVQQFWLGITSMASEWWRSRFFFIWLRMGSGGWTDRYVRLSFDRPVWLSVLVIASPHLPLPPLLKLFGRLNQISRPFVSRCSTLRRPSRKATPEQLQ